MYRWVEHTAEVELHVESEIREEVFEEALAAFGELVSRDDGKPVEHEVAVQASDDASLLVAWLEELVFLAETEDFVPERVSRLELRPGRLTARLTGRRDAPAHLVKAVTYHGLEFALRDGRWRARVVLDV